jgi:peptide/nickel transport system ATP-binding protein/oligopeptide transport system ATP-binding protein
MASVLEIRDLHVSYRSREGVLCPALAGVSFDLMPGEIMGVLGESGSGKSTLAVSLVRLLPGNAEITRGAVHFEGKDLLQAKSDELQQIRGRRISLIFQEPSLALHPTMRVGEQVRQVLAAHSSLNKSALNERTRQVFAEVFPEEADRISRSYPHQLSGGQRQRVLIAQAIACDPSMVIADEPTASLDAATQMEILGVFRTLREKLGLAMIFITHNPALLSGFADRVLVLYGGQVVECGPAATVLASPRHPYTKALFASIPTVFDERGSGRKTKLPVILGDSSLSSVPRAGCPFEPRCAERMDICREREPALVNVSASHIVSCFKYES